MKNPLASVAKLFKNSTKARLFLTFIILVLIAGSVFFGFKALTNNGQAGESQLSSIPDTSSGTQSPNDLKTANQQYIETLLQSQNQAAQRALKTGQTQIPSIVAAQKEQSQGEGFTAKPKKTQQNQGQGEQQSPDSIVDQLAKNGDISQSTAQQIKKLNHEGLTPDEYKKRLQKLVDEGKLSQKQANRLEKAYRQKHGGSINAQGNPDNMSPSLAQKLKKLKNQDLTPSEYRKRLQKLVREGKLTQQQADQLANAYKKQYNKQHNNQGTSSSNQSPDDLVDTMLKNGNISKSTAEQLKKLNNEGLTPSQYKKRLQKLVREGKISQEQANQLEKAYNKKHGGEQKGGNNNQTSTQGGASSKSNNKTKPSNLSPQHLNKLVQEGKLSPERAQELLRQASPQWGNKSQPSSKQKKDFNKKYQSGTTPLSYAKQLNTAVNNDNLSPSKAEKLLQNYKSFYNKKQQSKRQSTQPKTKEGKKAQQQLNKINKQANQAEQRKLRKQQQKLQTKEKQRKQQAKQEAQQQAQKQLKNMQQAMSKQMSQLIDSWKPSSQKIAGRFSEPPQQNQSNNNQPSSNGSQGQVQQGQTQLNKINNGKTKPQKKPAIRAGDILFAVLDTGINTDRPGPIMATIVSGQFKDAKLMGTLSVTNDHEAVKLKFNRMIMPHWRHSQSINALAINPKTAHTALASSVNHHYLVRFGSIIASSFLQGVGEAVEKSGQTNVSGNGTTTQTVDNFSTRDEALIGLGKVGEKMSGAAKKEFNRNPTVKVKPGTSMGILFMNDVIISQGAGQKSQQPNIMNSKQRKG